MSAIHFRSSTRFSYAKQHLHFQSKILGIPLPILSCESFNNMEHFQNISVFFQIPLHITVFNSYLENKYLVLTFLILRLFVH